MIGLVNATALRPGDTLYAGEPPVEFPPIPSFAPEHFAVVRGKDAGKAKQFRRGIEQLDTEGVVQVLSSDLRGDQAPVLAAVGPLQFDVVLHRLEHEFGARAELDHLDYTLARRTDAEGARALAGQRATEVLTRRHDGALLALFSDKWRLGQVQREHPDILLEPLHRRLARRRRVQPWAVRAVDLVEVADAVPYPAAAGPLPHQRVLAGVGLAAEELRAAAGLQAPADGALAEARGLRQ